MLHLTFRQLEYIVAVAKHGSLTEAATELNISQPSLSVAITQVEVHLGAKLFIRRKGTAILITPRGKAFTIKAKDILRCAKDLEDPSASVNEHAQTVRFGVFEDLAPQFLAPILLAARRDVKHIRLVPIISSFETLAAKLHNGQLDLTLTYDLGLDAAFDCTVLTQIAPSAFFPASGDFVNMKSISLERLEKFPLILFDEGLSIQHVLQLFKSKGLRPRITHRVNSIEVMRSLAANGEGIGISYTTPPSEISYDAKTVHAIRISDKEAKEPLILARSALLEPSSSALSLSKYLSESVLFRG